MSLFQYFSDVYDPNDRLCVGPNLLTAALRFVCDLEGEDNISPGVFTAEKCLGVNVLLQQLFYPVNT